MKLTKLSVFLLILIMLTSSSFIGQTSSDIDSEDTTVSMKNPMEIGTDQRFNRDITSQSNETNSSVEKDSPLDNIEIDNQSSHNSPPTESDDKEIIPKPEPNFTDLGQGAEKTQLPDGFATISKFSGYFDDTTLQPQTVIKVSEESRTELIIKGQTSNDIQSVFDQYDVNEIKKSTSTNYLLVSVPIIDIKGFKEELHQTGIQTELNTYHQLSYIPNDYNSTKLYGLDQIGVDYAWNNSLGSSDILVAVIDTGIDYNHPDLQDNYAALGYDWVNDDTDPMDDNYHGTHVAGTIAAEIDNGIGITGVANVSIMAEKTLDKQGYGSTFDAIDAFNHAVDQGADIISNSWGGGSYSSTLQETINNATASGVMVVAAAGNDATDAKQYPAAYDNVVAVTATNQNDTLASFSNYGDWVDIAAPGNDIYSTLPNGEYGTLSGTSMATPMVSGLAALLMSTHTGYTPAQIEDLIYQSATDLGDQGFDRKYGFGRISAQNAINGLNTDIAVRVTEVTTLPTINDPIDTAFEIQNFGSSTYYNATIQVEKDGFVTHLFERTNQFLDDYDTILDTIQFTVTNYGLYNITIQLETNTTDTYLENSQDFRTLSVNGPLNFNSGDHLYMNWPEIEAGGNNLLDLYSFDQISGNIAEGYTTTYDQDTGLEIHSGQFSLDLTTRVYNGPSFSGSKFIMNAPTALETGSEFTWYFWKLVVNETITYNYQGVNRTAVSALHFNPNFVNDIFIFDQQTGVLLQFGNTQDIIRLESTSKFGPSNDMSFYKSKFYLKNSLRNLPNEDLVEKPRVGDHLYIPWYVKNTGQTSLTFNVTLFINDVEIDVVDGIGLLSRGSYKYRFEYIPRSYGTYNFTFYLQTNETTEYTGNNVYTRIYEVEPIRNYQASTPSMTWYDAVSNGIEIGLSENGYVDRFLSHKFEFYGTNFTKIRINADGYIQLGPSTDRSILWHQSEGFPQQHKEYENIISPFWHYNLHAEGNVYIWTEVDFTVIEYNSYTYSDGSSLGNFQVVLFKNGSILFQYDSITENKGATVGLNYGVNDFYYSNNDNTVGTPSSLAILYEPTIIANDLQVRLNHDSVLPYQQGSLYNHTAVVTNIGASNQSNVEIDLYIDNTLVATDTFSSLLVNKSVYIDFETTLNYGIFDISANVTSDTGDDRLSNNVDNREFYMQRPLQLSPGTTLTTSFSGPFTRKLTINQWMITDQVTNGTIKTYEYGGRDTPTVTDHYTDINNFVDLEGEFAGTVNPFYVTPTLRTGSIFQYDHLDLDLFYEVTGEGTYDLYGFTRNVWYANAYNNFGPTLIIDKNTGFIIEGTLSSIGYFRLQHTSLISNQYDSHFREMMDIHSVKINKTTSVGYQLVNVGTEPVSNFTVDLYENGILIDTITYEETFESGLNYDFYFPINPSTAELNVELNFEVSTKGETNFGSNSMIRNVDYLDTDIHVGIFDYIPHDDKMNLYALFDANNIAVSHFPAMENVHEYNTTFIHADGTSLVQWQISELTNYIFSGGNLVVFDPYDQNVFDQSFDPTLGMTTTNLGGYTAQNTTIIGSHPLTSGITAVALPYSETNITTTTATPLVSTNDDLRSVVATSNYTKFSIVSGYIYKDPYISQLDTAQLILNLANYPKVKVKFAAYTTVSVSNIGQLDWDGDSKPELFYLFLDAINNQVDAPYPIRADIYVSKFNETTGGYDQYSTDEMVRWVNGSQNSYSRSLLIGELAIYPGDYTLNIDVFSNGSLIRTISHEFVGIDGIDGASDPYLSSFGLGDWADRDFDSNFDTIISERTAYFNVSEETEISFLTSVYHYLPNGSFNYSETIWNNYTVFPEQFRLNNIEEYYVEYEGTYKFGTAVYIDNVQYNSGGNSSTPEIFYPYNQNNFEWIGYNVWADSFIESNSSDFVYYNIQIGQNTNLQAYYEVIADFYFHNTSSGQVEYLGQQYFDFLLDNKFDHVAVPILYHGHVDGEVMIDIQVYKNHNLVFEEEKWYNVNNLYDSLESMDPNSTPVYKTAGLKYSSDFYYDNSFDKASDTVYEMNHITYSFNYTTDFQLDLSYEFYNTTSSSWQLMRVDSLSETGTVGTIYQELFLIAPETGYYRINETTYTNGSLYWSNSKTYLLNAYTGPEIVSSVSLSSTPNEETNVQLGDNELLQWTTDVYIPSGYEIYLNGTQVQSGEFDNEVPIDYIFNGDNIGTYVLKIVVNNVLGNVTDQITITVVDTISPSISTDSYPSTIELGTIGNAWTISISDADNGSYEVVQGSTIYDSGSWISGTLNINLDGLSIGSYTFEVTITDYSGNSASLSISVEVEDTTTPSLGQPSDTTIEQGSAVSVEWTYTDASTGSYVLYQNDTSVDSGTLSESDIITYGLSTLDYGYYNFTVVVTDDEGNSIKHTVWITIQDTTAPTVSTLSNPSPIELGSSGNSWQISVSDLNPGTYEVSKNGQPGYTSGSWSSTSIIINLDGLSIGTHSFEITVYDEIGHSSSLSITVEVVDTASPSVSTSGNFDYAEGTTGNELSFTISDATKGTYVVLRNGTQFTSGTYEPDQTISISIDGLTKNIYNLTIIPTDDLGNEGYLEVYVEVFDNTDPMTDNPADFWYGVGSTGNSISWTVTESYPDHYTIYQNGTNVDSGTYVDDETLSINIDGLEIGTYEFKLELNDTSGNSNNDSVIVEVREMDDPVMTSVDDFTYEYGSTGNEVSWTGTDASPDTYVLYQNSSVLSEGVWESDTAITVSIDGFEVGTYNFTLVIYDEQSNFARDTAFLTVVDTTAPSFQSQPSDFSYDVGSTGNQLIWSVDDYHPSEYEIFRNGTSVISGDWTSDSEISLNIDGLSAGTYLFEITVSDEYGNTAEDTVVVTVNQEQTSSTTSSEEPTSTTLTNEDTPDETESETTQEGLLGLDFGLLVIITLLSSVTMARRRYKQY